LQHQQSCLLVGVDQSSGGYTSVVSLTGCGSWLSLATGMESLAEGRMQQQQQQQQQQHDTEHERLVR
jgi:hypothetical protein